MAKRSPTHLEQAAKAHRIAKDIPDDEAAKSLLALAEEYEALAKEEEDESKDTMH